MPAPALFWFGAMIWLRQKHRHAAVRHLEEVYAAAAEAEEPHLLAASRQYRYSRMIEQSDPTDDTPAAPPKRPKLPGST